MSDSENCWHSSMQSDRTSVPLPVQGKLCLVTLFVKYVNIFDYSPVKELFSHVYFHFIQKSFYYYQLEFGSFNVGITVSNYN